MGSGTMGPLDLRFAHQDHTEGPLHGGAGGPWAYGPVCMKASTYSFFLLDGYFTLCSTRGNMGFARIWGHGALEPAVILLLSNGRTRGHGWTRGPRGPWTGDSGKRQTTLSAIPRQAHLHGGATR